MTRSGRENEEGTEEGGESKEGSSIRKGVAEGGHE